MPNIIDSLKWRYATKQFDPNKRLTSDRLAVLLEAPRLSASSFGLQPWKFVVVTNPAVRAKLREAGYGQPQITDSTALIVFCVRTDVNDAYVDKYIADIAMTRGVSVDFLKSFADSMKGSLKSKGSSEAVKEWSSRQVYIALGTLLAAAASLGIDACPMEGFDPKKFDEILGLEKLRLESRALAAVGFRLGSDPAAALVKVRFPKEEVIVEVK